MIDVLIIGGGISGFYCALECLKRNKTVLLCEKYKNVGGRIDTYNENGYRWESGAGRISKQHSIILSLMKKYKQPFVPISKDILYKSGECIEENLFEPNIQAFFEPLKQLSKSVLASSTLKELCIQIHGKEKTVEFLDRFPYRAEVEVLRADLGLESFNNEMGSHEGYFVAANGLHSLIEEMEKDFISKGGNVLTNYELIDIKKNNCTFLTGPRKVKNRPIEMLEARKIICAMDSESLKKISYFKKFKTLNYLRMEPLLRTYAVYDTPWFSQYPRIVTNSNIRYFLPINYEKGIAMVSYTDSRDTQKFHNIIEKYGEENLGKHIQNKLTELFGSIPNYKFFKAHYWKYGATYWLPGNYDPVEESRKSLKPFDSEVYLVNESFSLKQAWMEGSLEQCKKLFDTYNI
jgi:protoporphyrinogen oxidase